MNARARLIRAETMIRNVAREMKEGTVYDALNNVVRELNDVLVATRYVDKLPPVER